MDTFVVNSLNNLMDNDCTIGWPINQNIGTQIVIAKPKSRFLKLWLQSYQDYSNYLSIVFNILIIF